MSLFEVVGEGSYDPETDTLDMDTDTLDLLLDSAAEDLEYRIRDLDHEEQLYFLRHLQDVVSNLRFDRGEEEQ